MPALSREQMLLEEAIAIHGEKKVKATFGEENVTAIKAGGPVSAPLAKGLYRALHDLQSTALCLSGGGIRSASFGLGVIEALAVHPRQPSTPKEGDKQAANEDSSLLSQFNYVSTVSGGGYVGSWLSAWIARSGYATVWRKLVGRRERPDAEPSEIAWLRAYSNYLTPRLGLFSGDTWTAIALYIRNLVLNWLVILPALCLLLLVIKALAAGAFWLTTIGGYWRGALAVLAAFLMVWALRFALRNRPSFNPCPATDGAKTSELSAVDPSGRMDPHRNEAARTRPGADEWRFQKNSLLPALAAALLLTLYLTTRRGALDEWELWSTSLLAMAAGTTIYAVSWILALPPAFSLPPPDEHRGPLYWAGDFVSWSIAGAVYGAILGLGVYLFAHHDGWLLLGNIESAFDPALRSFLIAFIYGVPWIITAQLTAEMIFVGLTNLQRYSDPDREWFGRSTGWFTVAACMWPVVTFLVLIGTDLGWDLVANSIHATYGGSFLAIASALFTTLGSKWKSAAKDQAETKSDLMMRIALPLAAIIFLILLVLVVSALIDYLLFEESFISTSLLDREVSSEQSGNWWWLVVGFVVAGAIAFAAWKYVNINRFSLHALYRNRIIRAYLGASNPHRTPNPFTGFDEADNVRMRELWPPKNGSWQPFHVVNIALNAVNSDRLAWQERKAEPFTVTPLHSGSAGDGLGYRRSGEYGDLQRGGISLGTAVAISGAAASPNMGYHSSPLVTLLLALFNVRLGWWLGNPGPHGEPDYFQSDGPKWAIRPFVAEMFGLTTDKSAYVYLSDGGHFENLGLYEMIRRRCHRIVISDAGCDPTYGFEDLGNAVRKIAIDLGVYVTFSALREIKQRSKDNSVIKGAYYAIGEIDYKTAPEHNADLASGSDAKEESKREKERGDVENGYILYIKPSYLGTESAGIVAYAAANAAFPHETTADQFFSESQFESYRTLGFEIMNTVLKDATQRINVAQRDKTDAAHLAPSTAKLRDLIRIFTLEPTEQADS